MVVLLINLFNFNLLKQSVRVLNTYITFYVVCVFFYVLISRFGGTFDVPVHERCVLVCSSAWLMIRYFFAMAVRISSFFWPQFDRRIVQVRFHSYIYEEELM